MTSALKEGRPCGASAWTMCRRICVGPKNGCSCDSRDRGCERSITRTASSLLSGHRLAHLDDAGDDRVDHPLAELAPCPCRVADDARLRDVAEHVHRDDHTGSLRTHLVA